MHYVTYRNTKQNIRYTYILSANKLSLRVPRSLMKTRKVLHKPSNQFFTRHIFAFL